MTERLAWNCQVCHALVPDNAGYLTIDLEALGRYRREYQAWKAKHSTNGMLCITGFELLAMPEPPSWEVLHRSCDPCPESDDYWIGVEGIRTPAAVLSWTAHLLKKSWFPDSQWGDVIYQIVLPQLQAAS